MLVYSPLIGASQSWLRKKAVTHKLTTHTIITLTMKFSPKTPQKARFSLSLSLINFHCPSIGLKILPPIDLMLVRAQYSRDFVLTQSRNE